MEKLWDMATGKDRLIQVGMVSSSTHCQIAKKKLRMEIWRLEKIV